MPAVCFYFQVHQPYRLKTVPFASIESDHSYFDDVKNGAVMKKVAEKCYLPTNNAMLKLIKKHGDQFKISYSITGVAIEQMQQFAPEVLDSFKRLVDTGNVELIGETYYHSLAALYDQDEFRAQARLHRELIQRVFGVTPRVFRNTELIFNEYIGSLANSIGYETVLAEGWDDVLGWRSPNFVYKVPGSDLRLLLKNYKLSDDVAFRFSNKGWECHPLSAETYASWIHRLSGSGDTVGLFMDYETFGEHQWADSGIFEFIERFPEYLLKHPDWSFLTPTEVASNFPVVGELPYTRLTSWADTERDISAWRSNRMQERALHDAFELGPKLRASGNESLLHIWRKLLTSDHFYYMCTKWFADGDVHAYFSPYDSPYEAFSFYMNTLRDFQRWIEKAL